MSSFVVRGGSSSDGRRLDVRIDGGLIAEVGPDLAGDGGAEWPGDLDASGLLVAPGFVDLQVNGAAGFDITSAPESIWAVGEALVADGVTAFLPTVVTSPPATVVAARDVLSAGQPPGYLGATPLGLHVEGPFLNPSRRGVHDAALLRLPDAAETADWSPRTGIALVTLAPELPGALELVERLADRGVVVSAGHSAATFEEGRAGIEAGIRYATHLFNGMPPFDHRAPGLVGALLADHRVTVGLIVDGVHLHPSTVALAWRAAGPGRVSVVTDAVSALGLPDGRHRIGEAAIEVGPDGARSGGRLAGGLTSLDAALRNLVAFTGATAAEAIATVTEVPARLLGLAASRGRLQPGCVADLTVLTPRLDVVGTIVRGRVAFADTDHAGWLDIDRVASSAGQ